MTYRGVCHRAVGDTASLLKMQVASTSAMRKSIQRVKFGVGYLYLTEFDIGTR